MARDLIPPPSPAGRPEPDGAPRLIELPPERPPAAAAPAPAAVGPSRYRNRFGFLLGALGGALLAAAVVLAVVLITSSPKDEGLARNWSAWHPAQTSLTEGPAEIADHVGGQYHLANGKELVSVTGGPLEVQGIKLNVALRPASGTVQVLGGKAVMYTLNGLGANGSIVGGKATPQRHQLLRREALELALYSFRYLNVDMVVALLPPAPPSSSTGSSTATASTATQLQAVFYRPGDLKPQLQVPLGLTVPAKAPQPETIPHSEAQRIDSLTLSNLFIASFQQAQDLKPYLVLDRPT